MTPPQPEPKTVEDLGAAMREGNIDAGIGGAPPASQPVPAEMPTPEVERTEEDAVEEDAGEEQATEKPAEGEPEGEVPAPEPEATPEGGA